MESTLSEKTERLRKLYCKFEENLDVDKKEYTDAFNLCIQLTDDIRKEGIFSKNEEFKEIPPENYKYLIVPFYHAEICLKFVENRKNVVTFAIKYYQTFFSILKDYEFLSKEVIQ